MIMSWHPTVRHFKMISQVIWGHLRDVNYAVEDSIFLFLIRRGSNDSWRIQRVVSFHLLGKMVLLSRKCIHMKVCKLLMTHSKRKENWFGICASWSYTVKVRVVIDWRQSQSRQLFEVERRSTAGLNSKTMMNCMRQPTETIALNLQLPRLGFVHESREPLAISIPVYCCSCSTWPTKLHNVNKFLCSIFTIHKSCARITWPRCSQALFKAALLNETCEKNFSLFISRKT